MPSTGSGCYSLTRASLLRPEQRPGPRSSPGTANPLCAASLRKAGGLVRDDRGESPPYISYAISLGIKLATVCAQTGTSPAMIEKHYGR